MERVHSEEQVSVNLDDRGYPAADSESESSDLSSVQFGGFVRNGLIRLEEGNDEYSIIKKGFLSGMEAIGKDTSLVAVHKNSFASFTGRARLESFSIFSEAVAKKRGGNPNINYAWFGASRDTICEIISHGFSKCGEPASRDSYGFGIYLSPVKFSADSAASCVPDKNGLRYLLLCRVILGTIEMVSPGSKRFHPSSKEFDTGVDNLFAPRRYVVWTANMNSHILPAYIVTFKAPCVKGCQTRQASLVRPSSPWMRFATLMSMLARFLPPPTMAVIVRYHGDYRKAKMTRMQFIQRLRQLAGDELLIEVIKSYRSQVQLPD